jgi:hypothetical protein
MIIDLYSKIVLTVIALSLMTIALQSLSIVPKAVASGSIHCTGKLNANENGGIASEVGGYYVDVNCR